MLSTAMNRVGIPLSVGFFLGAALMYEANMHDRKPKRSRHKAEKPAEAVTSAHETRDIHPFIGAVMPRQQSYLRVSNNFVAEYNTATRCPKWVTEHLTPDILVKKADRASYSFKEDPVVPAIYRSKLADYEFSGYDRGHCAPAANNRSAPEHLGDSFYLSNIAPQVGIGFNRDYWARLEAMVRNLVHSFPHVYVVTGPAWLPTAQPMNNTITQNDGLIITQPATDANFGQWQFRFSGIGKNARWIHVPTHFFKVVMVADGDNKPKAIATFLIPNTTIDSNTPITEYLVPTVALEYILGADLFPTIPRFEKLAAESAHSGNITASVLLQHYARQLGIPINSLDALHLEDVAVPSLPSRVEMAAKAGGKEGVQVPPPRVLHLCNIEDCSLPPPNWFVKDRDKDKDKEKEKENKKGEDKEGEEKGKLENGVEVAITLAKVEGKGVTIHNRRDEMHTTLH